MHCSARRAVRQQRRRRSTAVSRRRHALARSARPRRCQSSAVWPHGRIGMLWRAKKARLRRRRDVRRASRRCDTIDLHLIAAPRMPLAGALGSPCRPCCHFDARAHFCFNYRPVVSPSMDASSLSRRTRRRCASRSPPSHRQPRSWLLRRWQTVVAPTGMTTTQAQSGVRARRGASASARRGMAPCPCLAAATRCACRCVASG